MGEVGCLLLNNASIFLFVVFVCMCVCVKEDCSHDAYAFCCWFSVVLVLSTCDLSGSLCLLCLTSSSSCSQ